MQADEATIAWNIPRVSPTDVGYPLAALNGGRGEVGRVGLTSCRHSLGGRDRCLLVERQSPLLVAARVNGRHQGMEVVLDAAGCAPCVDQRGGVRVDFDQAFVADVVGLPRRCVVEGGDHRFAVHGQTVGEDHHSVWSHETAVKVRTGAVTQ